MEPAVIFCAVGVNKLTANGNIIASIHKTIPWQKPSANHFTIKDGKELSGFIEKLPIYNTYSVDKYRSNS